MENTENIVKLSFDGQMRRFPFKGTSFAALYGQIIALLGLEQNADILLKYADEEGDLITISSDLELKSAFVAGQLLRVVATYRMDKVEQPASVPALSVPFAQVGETFKAFEHGCGGGYWPGNGYQVSDDKERKKAFKLMKKMHRGAHHGRFGPEFHGGPRFRGPYGGPHVGPHGGHGPFGGPHGGPHGGRGPFGGPHGGPHGGHGPFGGPHGPHFGPHNHHGPYDGQQDSEKLVARFAKDVTIEDGTQIAANTAFVKIWRIRNDGIAWPAGCVLRFVGKHSDDMGAPEFVPVEGIVAPEQEVDISVNLIAPSKPGRYTGYWKMCTADGRKFGQRVWVSIVVPSNGSSSEGEKEADKFESLVDVVLAKEHLRTFGVKRHRVFRLLQKFNGDVDKVILVLTEKLAKKEEKYARKAEKQLHKQMKKDFKK